MHPASHQETWVLSDPQIQKRWIVGNTLALGILDRIAVHGSPPSVPELRHILFASELAAACRESDAAPLSCRAESASYGEVAAASGRAIKALLERDLSGSASWLVRPLYAPWEPPRSGTREEVLQLLAVREQQEDGAILAGVASLDADGYVRERAVESLEKFPGPNATVFLVLRLNDCVQQVRQRAELAVLQRMESGEVRSLVRSLTLFDPDAPCH